MASRGQPGPTLTSSQPILGSAHECAVCYLGERRWERWICALIPMNSALLTELCALRGLGVRAMCAKNFDPN